MLLSLFMSLIPFVCLIFATLSRTLSFSAVLHHHLEEHNVEYLQFSFRWMNNLLMREIPLRCSIRLWDTFLVSELLYTVIDVIFSISLKATLIGDRLFLFIKRNYNNWTTSIHVIGVQCSVWLWSRWSAFKPRQRQITCLSAEFQIWSRYVCCWVWFEMPYWRHCSVHGAVIWKLSSTGMSTVKEDGWAPPFICWLKIWWVTTWIVEIPEFITCLWIRVFTIV